MNRFEEIIGIADSLVSTYGTRNSWELADGLEVSILYRNFQEQKGVFTMIKGMPFVFLNLNLEEEQQNIVLVHELGHFLLHLDELGAIPMLIEDSIFDKSCNRQEYEANLFTSQILLPTEEILEYLYNGCTQEEIAQVMRSDVNLVAIKIKTLIEQGYEFKALEYKRNFL